MRRVLLAALVAALTILPMLPATAATVVNENRLGQDWFRADSRGAGTLAFDATYGGVASSAAVVLATPESADKVQLLTTAHSGTRLADVTALGYSTLRAPESTGFPAAVPSLNLRVDRDGDGVVDTYLIYEPYQDAGNAAVVTGVWQTWDALRGGAARWWGSHLPGCGQSAPCSWATVVASYPAARILEDPNAPINSPSAPAGGLHGSFGINLGSGNPGIVAAVDALTIGVSGAVTVYDFQNLVTLSGREACKDGGWAASTAPEFRNQGDCVSWFASQGRTHSGR